MHNDNWPEGHIPEFLSGFQAEIEFMSFDDIRKNGIADDIGIIINWGCSGSAWSGGHHWADPLVVEKIRAWVDQGGGFIGVGDPTAHEYEGRFFQLADVLGVEKETGNRLAWAKNIRPEVKRDHFILETIEGKIDLGVAQSAIYLVSEDAELLAGTPDAVLLSTNTFGNGRSVYFADYLHNPQNMRLLHRAILWASGQEHELKQWFSTDINTDCAYYPEAGQFVVMNNSEQNRDTTVYTTNGKSMKVLLKPLEMKWFTQNELDDICQ
jgi:1,3-beta-galactosyl-N-acetylhexosamine phosphorylase